MPINSTQVGDVRAESHGTGKAVQERSGAAAFDMAIEVISQDE